MALLWPYKVMTSPRTPNCSLCIAFSLVEVITAIAVVAFALVAIAGSLPVGLQSMRDSQNDQAVGTIQTQLRGNLEQLSYDGTVTPNIYQLSGSNSYYTVEGVPTDSVSTTLVAYYRAQFAITNAGVNGNAFAGTATYPTNSAAVTIVLSYPSPGFSQTNRFTMLATKQVGN